MDQNFFEFFDLLAVCLICIAGAAIGTTVLVIGALVTAPVIAVLLVATFIYGRDPLPPSKATA